MKKKSPPYAIIGAVVLGIITVAVFFHIKSVQDQEIKAREDKMMADMQAKIDAATAKQPITTTETPQHMRNVLYATQPVEAGAKISPAFYEKKLTPDEILPDAYAESSDITGFFAIRKIEKGDPLTPRNIGKSLPYMSQRIPPGMRALALPVYNAENNSTGGFVVDGDRVDLLYTPKGEVKARTQVLLQNVDVLFVPGPQNKTDLTDGVNPAPAPGEPVSVVFLVTTEQAQALVYFTGAGGQINMILRGRKDKDVVKIKPFEGADYLGNVSKVQAKTDKSLARVQELQEKIEAAEKAAQGPTNETTTPKPPSP